MKERPQSKTGRTVVKKKHGRPVAEHLLEPFEVALARMLIYLARGRAEQPESADPDKPA